MGAVSSEVTQAASTVVRARRVESEFQAIKFVSRAWNEPGAEMIIPVPGDARQLKALLAPFPSDEMTCWPVSTRADSVKNNDPSLIEPIVFL